MKIVKMMTLASAIGCLASATAFAGSEWVTCHSMGYMGQDMDSSNARQMAVDACVNGYNDYNQCLSNVLCDTKCVAYNNDGVRFVDTSAVPGEAANAVVNECSNAWSSSGTSQCWNTIQCDQGGIYVPATPNVPYPQPYPQPVPPPYPYPQPVHQCILHAADGIPYEGATREEALSYCLQMERARGTPQYCSADRIVCN